MSIISNCCSSGADSYANPVTGAVARKDKLTGQEVAATVRPNGVPDAGKTDTSAAVAGVSLSPEVLGTVLQLTQV